MPNSLNAFPQLGIQSQYDGSCSVSTTFSSFCDHVYVPTRSLHHSESSPLFHKANPLLKVTISTSFFYLQDIEKEQTGAMNWDLRHNL